MNLTRPLLLIVHAWNLLGGHGTSFWCVSRRLRWTIVAEPHLSFGRTLDWAGSCLDRHGLVGLNPQLTYHIREARMYGLMAVTVVLLAVVALRFDQCRDEQALA